MTVSIEALHALVTAAEWARLSLEVIGALTVVIGAVATLADIARQRRAGVTGGWTRSRLTLARYLALGLEFQLAADIVGSSIAPTWTSLGQLAATAAIRTGLNYFLGRDASDDRMLLAERASAAHAA